MAKQDKNDCLLRRFGHEASIHRIPLRPEDFVEHGFTEQCAKCRSILRWASQLGHSHACCGRMQKAIAQTFTGHRSVRQQEEKENQMLAQKMEKHANLPQALQRSSASSSSAPSGARVEVRYRPGAGDTEAKRVRRATSEPILRRSASRGVDTRTHDRNVHTEGRLPTIIPNQTHAHADAAPSSSTSMDISCTTTDCPDRCSTGKTGAAAVNGGRAGPTQDLMKPHGSTPVDPNIGKPVWQQLRGDNHDVELTSVVTVFGKPVRYRKVRLRLSRSLPRALDARANYTAPSKTTRSGTSAKCTTCANLWIQNLEK